MAKRQIRVLCVDDHAFLVEGLRTRFEMEGDIECVGRLSTAEDLVEQVRYLEPNVVILDIEMPGPDPFEAAAEVHRVSPQSRVVFLSAYVRDHYISAAINAGAWGYFSKSDEAADIVAGIRKVVGGAFAFGPRVEARCQPPSHNGRGDAGGRSGGSGRAGDRGRANTTAAPTGSRLDLLTSREQEVLRLIGKGHQRAEIAKLLCRSAKTIDGHRESIMQKLDIHDRAELVRYAIREGLVEA